MRPNCGHSEYSQCREAGCFEGMEPEQFRAHLARRHAVEEPNGPARSAAFDQAHPWAEVYERALGGWFLPDRQSFPRALLIRLLDAAYQAGRTDAARALNDPSER